MTARHRTSGTARPRRVGGAIGSWVVALLLLLLAALLLGPLPAQAQPAGTGSDALLRLAQLQPDLPDVELVVSSVADSRKRGVRMLHYGDVGTYRMIEPGDYVITMRPAGSTEPAAVSRALSVQPGMAYTVAAVQHEKTPDDLRVLTDDLTPPAQDRARARVISAAPPAPQLDAQPLASGVPRGDASAYRDVAPGIVDLSVGAPGTPAATLPVTLAANQVSSVVLTSADGVDAGRRGRRRGRARRRASGSGARGLRWDGRPGAGRRGRQRRAGRARGRRRRCVGPARPARGIAGLGVAPGTVPDAVLGAVLDVVGPNPPWQLGLATTVLAGVLLWVVTGRLRLRPETRTASTALFAGAAVADEHGLGVHAGDPAAGGRRGRRRVRQAPPPPHAAGPARLPRRRRRGAGGGRRPARAAGGHGAHPGPRGAPSARGAVGPRVLGARGGRGARDRARPARCGRVRSGERAADRPRAKARPRPWPRRPCSSAVSCGGGKRGFVRPWARSRRWPPAWRCPGLDPRPSCP